MGWKINGVPHTGEIITVGPSGRDFTSLVSAVGAASAGALLLVDPGLYLCNTYYGLVMYGSTKYLRGLGDQPGDVIIRNTDSSEETVFVGNGIIENVMIDQKGSDPRSCIAFNNNMSTACVVSKCRFTGVQMSNSPHTTVWNRYGTAYGTLTARYCDFERVIPENFTFNGHYNGASTYNIALYKMTVQRCLMPGRAYGQYVTYGDQFAELDRVMTSSDGYGPNYGDFLITEGGGAIAAKEQYYRRLRNG